MDVFVYGTLQSPALMAAVAGSDRLLSASAGLSDHAALTMSANVAAHLAPRSGAVCDGILWRDLSEDQIRRLDIYAAAYGQRRGTVDVRSGADRVAAQCYMPADGAAAARDVWDFDTWEQEHLLPALLAAEELFSHRPLPDPGAARRMWPMIEARAWAKHRAVAGPATIRHEPGPKDMRVVASRPPRGSFFRLQSLDVTHRHFDGGQSHVLVREAFVGVDAATVLPYDPVRDRVVLVEQFRMGPLVRRDPNPWMLEPVAGIVDARETPEDAARREAKEEAGLVLTHLEPVSAYYTSPGSSTDYLYSYVGLCDLPQTASYGGGLDTEGEDLRLHPMALDDALALADSGEIATGPLVLILNWLARHRDRLRAMA